MRLSLMVLNILEKVVNLSDEERKELSETLNKTNLSSVVSLVKLLENRLNTIIALKTLVFNFEKETNERDHIQKIIENSYSNLKKDREKELVKINKLKNTIKKEQKEGEDIYKRHPFVRTIIKSRS